MLHFLHEATTDGQTETEDHQRAICLAASHATGVSGRAELCERLFVCPWQNEQHDSPPKRNVSRCARSVWFAVANGLQRPPPGRSDLQEPVDQVAQESG